MRHSLFRRYQLVLALTMLLATACSRPAPTEEVSAAKVSLDQVRVLAGIALDGTVPGKERQQARNDAMGTLVALLKRTESRDTVAADWEKPLASGPRILRVFESGPVRVFSLTLPSSGIVPPGERLAVQFRDGVLQANELPVMPGGSLVAARTLTQGRGQLSLTLAFSLAHGGGYVAHYQRDSNTGEFKPAAAAFKGVPAQVGEIGFDQRDGFLVVNTPMDGMWRPQFEQNQPLRLFLTSDIALDWKDRFDVLDERNFNAFQGFATALDAKVGAAQRKEAWEKATHKLSAYLQEMPSWTDDLAPKLPSGGVVRADKLANLEVRAVSVPAPELADASAFTVVQYRTGNGLPSAQAVALPGAMADFRLVSQNGLPQLLFLSNPAGAPGTKRAVVTLLRLTADNTWAPASGWVGPLPVIPGVRLREVSGELVVDDAGTDATLTAVRALPVGELVAALEPAGARSMSEWVGSREVTAGGARWLLVLGRSPNAAAVLLYKWDSKGWQPANALDTTVNRLIVERGRLSYTPGQTQPVRGLYAAGAGVTGAFTSDGQGVRFCESERFCATYQFVNGWTIR